MVGVPFKVCLPGGQLVGVVAYNFVHLGQVLKAKFGLGGELNFSLDDGTLICDQDYFELLPPQTKLNVTASIQSGLQPDGETPLQEYCFHTTGQRRSSDESQPLPSPVHSRNMITPQMLSPPLSTPNAVHVADLRITSVAGNVRMTSPPPPQTMSPSSQYFTLPGFVSPEAQPLAVPYQQYVNMTQRQNYYQAHMEQIARLHQRNVVVHPGQLHVQGRPLNPLSHPVPLQPAHRTKQTVLPVEPVVPGLPQPIYPVHHPSPLQMPYRTQCRFETPLHLRQLQHRQHHQQLSQNKPIPIREELNRSIVTPSNKISPPTLLTVEDYPLTSNAHSLTPEYYHVSRDLHPPQSAQSNMNINNVRPCVLRPQDLIGKVGGPPAQSTVTTAIQSKDHGCGNKEGERDNFPAAEKASVAELMTKTQPKDEKQTNSTPQSIAAFSMDRPILMTDGLHQVVIQPAELRKAVTDQIQNQSSVVPPAQTMPADNVNTIPAVETRAMVAVKTEDSEDEGELYIDETACSTPMSGSPSATSVKCNTFFASNGRSTPEVADRPDNLLQTVKMVEDESSVSDSLVPSVVETGTTPNDSMLALEMPGKDVIRRLPFADFDSSDDTTPAKHVTSEGITDGSQDCVNKIVSIDMDANTDHESQNFSEDEHDSSMIVSYPRVYFSPLQKEAVCSTEDSTSISLQTDDCTLNFDQLQPTVEKSIEDLQAKEVSEPVDELKVSIHTVCIDGQVYVDHCSYYDTIDNDETSTAEFDVYTPSSLPVSHQSVCASHPQDDPTSTQSISMSKETLPSQVNHTAHQPDSLQPEQDTAAACNVDEEMADFLLNVAKYAREEVTFTQRRYCNTADIERCSAELLSVALGEQYKSSCGTKLDGSSKISILLPGDDTVAVPVEESVLVDSTTVPSSAEEDGVSVDSLLEDSDFFNIRDSFTMDLSEESEDDTVFHFADDTINEVTLPLDITEPPTPSGQRLVMLTERSDRMETEVVEMDCRFQASSVPIADYYTSLSAYGYDPTVDIPLGNKATEQ